MTGILKRERQQQIVILRPHARKSAQEAWMHQLPKLNWRLLMLLNCLSVAYGSGQVSWMSVPNKRPRFSASSRNGVPGSASNADPLLGCNARARKHSVAQRTHPATILVWRSLNCDKSRKEKLPPGYAICHQLSVRTDLQCPATHGERGQ